MATFELTSNSRQVRLGKGEIMRTVVQPKDWRFPKALLFNINSGKKYFRFNQAPGLVRQNSGTRSRMNTGKILAKTKTRQIPNKEQKNTSIL